MPLLYLTEKPKVAGPVTDVSYASAPAGELNEPEPVRVASVGS